MKSLEENIKRLTAARDRLNDDNLSVIDFDQLLRMTDLAINGMNDQVELLKQLDQFKQDYIQRISGMAKGIVIADRKQGETSQLVDLMVELPNLSAEELIASYHRVAARFRDMFPASYTRNWSENNKTSAIKHPEQFK